MEDEGLVVDGDRLNMRSTTGLGTEARPMEELDMEELIMEGLHITQMNMGLPM